MSLENSLERIANALEALAAKGNIYPEALPTEIPAVLNRLGTPPPEPPVAVPPTQTLAQETATPGPTPAVQEVPTLTPPFSDASGLIAYTMEAWKVLGAEKGARIQGILSEMGVGNINDLPPNLYGSFYAQIEALKGG